MKKFTWLFGFFLISPAAKAEWTEQKPDVVKAQFGVMVPSYNFELAAPKTVSRSVAKFEPNTPSKFAVESFLPKFGFHRFYSQ